MTRCISTNAELSGAAKNPRRSRSRSRRPLERNDNHRAFPLQQHKYYCGIDLHAKSIYICILDSNNEIKFNKNVKTNPESLLKTVKPFQDDIVAAVECMFSRYWVADTREDNGIHFILEHAL